MEKGFSDLSLTGNFRLYDWQLVCTYRVFVCAVFKFGADNMFGEPPKYERIFIEYGAEYQWSTEVYQSLTAKSPRRAQNEFQCDPSANIFLSLLAAVRC